MMPLKDKVYIFDFDGTIVDSMEEFADIASRVMPKYFPIAAEDARRAYLETSGIPFFQQLEQLFPGNDANARAADEFERTKLETYLEKKPFEDAGKTIQELRSKGAKAVVSSNNFQNLVDELTEKLGIEFDMVLGFKPGFAKGKDHFAHIERLLGAKRADMTFVGDSLRDGERAADYGIRFVAKEGIFPSEDFLKNFPDAKVISNLSELAKGQVGNEGNI
jgi:phosphoglycolate phosphatase